MKPFITCGIIVAGGLDNLAGKTIGFISNDMWQAHRMLPLLRDWFAEHHPDTTLVAETEFPMGNTLIDTDECVDKLEARGVDAVIIGNAS